MEKNESDTSVADASDESRGGGAGLGFTVVVVVVVLALFLAIELNLFQGSGGEDPLPNQPTVKKPADSKAQDVNNNGTVSASPVEIRFDPKRSPQDPHLPSRIEGKDGKTMVLIPSGSFVMGNFDTTDHSLANAEPSRLVTLDAYYMDQTEVTLGEFIKFIEDGGYYRQEVWSESGWSWRIQERRDSPGGAEDLVQVAYDLGKPMGYTIQNINRRFLTRKGVRNNYRYESRRELVNPGNYTIVEVKLQQSAIESGYTLDSPVAFVTFWEAEAYAKWAGKQLPSEAQWEKAARGDLDRRSYVFDPATFGGSSNPSIESLMLMAAFGNDKITPVGSHPKDVSMYGVLDLTGSVNEWCVDYFDFDAYRLTERRVTNPVHSTRGPSSRNERVVRGGNYRSDKADEAKVFYRRHSPTWDFIESRGFRCVLPASSVTPR